MSRRQTIKAPAFVLEIGGRAVLAFAAGDIDQAREFCAQDWFVGELSSYRSEGRPIWDGQTRLSIRPADNREACELQIALSAELTRDEYEGFIFAFFVPIDPGLQ